MLDAFQGVISMDRQSEKGAGHRATIIALRMHFEGATVVLSGVTVATESPAHFEGFGAQACVVGFVGESIQLRIELQSILGGKAMAPGNESFELQGWVAQSDRDLMSLASRLDWPVPRIAGPDGNPPGHPRLADFPPADLAEVARLLSLGQLSQQGLHTLFRVRQF